MVEAQQNPQSKLFHNWLTPVQFAARFGVAAQDVHRISNWLEAQGFTIDEIPAGNRLVIFSGSAAQVEEAFHTSLHYFAIDGVSHIGNVQDPQIPEALTGMVVGIVSLHDFRRTAASIARQPLGERLQASEDKSYLAPGDFAAIYDLNSLYSAGTNGAGVDIAIVGRSNISVGDVANFRSALGLPANNPTVIVDGPNPGVVTADEDDAVLNVEWSGALAPMASVKLVTAASTATTDGVDLAAQYVVNHATATVLSIGYGSCESEMGTTELAFYNALWEQAASEGITAIVSSGDSGAAGCGSSPVSAATAAGVNGLCSSPYSTCVGGTEFSENLPAHRSWMSANKGSDTSAPDYVPEHVWNESGNSGAQGARASGGGISAIYAQPNWQESVIGASVVNGMRAIPDVALPAAANSGYITYQNGSWWTTGGTSAAASSFASIVALVAESSAGKGLGNVNPSLYGLLNGASIPFHATSGGNNSVPGVPGFIASGEAYNMATGLGSVDGALFVSQLSAESVAVNDASNMPSPPAVPSPIDSPPASIGITPSSFSGSQDIRLAAESAELALSQGSTVKDVFSLTAVGMFQGPVSLTVSGLPSGVVASWSANPVILRSSETATVTLTLSAVEATPAVDNQIIVVTASGKGVSTDSQAISRGKVEAVSRLGGMRNSADLSAHYVCKVKIPQALGLQIALSDPTLSMQASGTANLTILVTQTSGDNSSVEISVGSPPPGVSLALGQPTQNGTSGTSTVLTLAGSPFAGAGSYTIPINVTSTGANGNSTTSWATMTLNLN
jgi:hypothetical protein